LAFVYNENGRVDGTKRRKENSMFHIDPLYYILIAPGFLFALWAQWRTKSAFNEGKKYRAASGLTGAQAAAEVMEAAGIRGVAIEPVEGFLSDHYDPSKKVLRLSPDVYGGQSLSAVGVAAHEAGHAIQDAQRYSALVLRNGLVPLAGIGSNLSWVLIFIGMALSAYRNALGSTVLLVGIVLFAITVLFQIINLPVEFDASKRARLMLVNHQIITREEDVIVRRVLNAAAMTYVAATVTAVLTLLYFLIRSGLLGGRRDD
jgi:Zn-dependent membrane protease YugP